MQINIGKFCNQTCRHCHVDAGPDRQEIMSSAIVDQCLDRLAASDIGTVDITGGAPELHERFRDIVEDASALGRKIILRANLTALFLPVNDGLAEFLSAHRVEITASLPYYLAQQTDAQRGRGVFDRSIEALRALNALGYGRGSGLQLNLMVNPVGRFLAAEQSGMERDWHRELERRHGIQFDSLYTITNMPIGRFLEYLQDSDNVEDYLHGLAQAFNPATVPSLMCRSTLSVGWDGRLYDCDFNQMLEMGMHESTWQTIADFEPSTARGREIAVGPHCYGCTAGSGSSCGGSLT
jgi:radical SAM/Cys-rich protein